MACLDVVIEDQVVVAVALQQRLRVLQVEVLKLQERLRKTRKHSAMVSA